LDVSSEEIIENKDLGPIQARHLTWSSNDNFIIMSTSDGKLYSYDLWGLDGTEPNSLKQIPNVVTGPSGIITYIDWDLYSHRIFYASPGLGIAAVRPGGTNYSLLYDAVANNTASRDIVSFSLDRKQLGTIEYVAADGKAYEYHHGAYAIEYPLQEVNALPGNRTAIESNRSSSQWSNYYPVYFASATGTDPAKIQAMEGLYTGTPTPSVFTSASSVPITDIDVLPIHNEATLYSPTVTAPDPTGLENSATLTYSVRFSTNSTMIQSVPIEITPVLYSLDGASYEEEPTVVPPDSVGIYGNGGATFELTLPEEGTYYLGCIIRVGTDPYLEQYCEADQTYTWLKQRLMVYRLANWKTHERLFTTDGNEVDAIDGKDGWVYENIAFSVYDQVGGTAVYRMANWKTHERLFTTDWNEVSYIKDKNGWVYEGVAFYADSSGISVYRMANWMTHERLFTTDANERDVIRDKNGWVYEGVAFYAPSLARI
jgi:hypothetical protein